MLRGVITGFAIVCLMGGVAYAQTDAPAETDAPADSPCAQALSAAQEAMQDKVDNNAIGEADQEKIYALLDDADSACSEGKSDEAMATLGTVNKMIAGK